MIKTVFTGAIAALWMALPALATNDDPLLKDSPSSEHYELEQVSGFSPANILYSPSNNFFLVGARSFVKIDMSGRKVFALKRQEHFTLLPFSHYVATLKGLYDLSQSHLKLEPFEQIVNGDRDRTFTVESFNKIYKQAYADADIVLYDVPNFEEDIDKYRAYMWIKGGWVLFYLSYRAITLDKDYEMGVTVQEYPAKFNRMVLLRDVQSKTYAAASLQLRKTTPRLKALLPESKLRYPARGKLKVLRYRNDRVDGTYRGKPVAYTGMAHYRLRSGDEDILFREIAYKALEENLETQLHWYVLPAPYQDRTQVGFLEMVQIHNFSTAGSEGVYVLRRK